MVNASDAFLFCTHVTPECPVEYSIYTYRPNLGANVFFLAAFAISAILQLFFGLKYRTWTFAIALVLGCLCETIGYVGRVLLSINPYDMNGFEIQYICLIIAPSFIAAGVYLSLKHFVLVFGEKYSLLRPNWYTWLFIVSDIIGLVMQGAGGAIAATGRSNSIINIGGDLEIAGIVWQVASLAIFGIQALQYATRVYLHRHELNDAQLGVARALKVRAYVCGLVIAYLTILTRCIYRIPELAGGWQNSVSHSEIAMY